MWPFIPAWLPTLTLITIVAACFAAEGFYRISERHNNDRKRTVLCEK